MKLKKYISIASLAILLGFASCGDQFDYDILVNPNAVTEENADVDLFFNAIQINFAAFFTTSSNLTMTAMRMTAMTGGNVYENAWSPASFNGLWNNSYAAIFPDISAMSAIAEEREQFIHIGAAQVMQGYVLLTLVDFFGDIPWTDALQGVSVPSPTSDDDSSVYDAAIALIDAGIENLGKTSRGAPGNDFFYGGDADDWIKAANTFKLKAYLNTGNTAAFDAIITSGNFIAASGDDFVFPYGTNRVNPNSRHPWYNEHYEVGNGRYHSNQNMYNMRFRYAVPDPRIRYYYYRQDLVYGDEPDLENQFTLDCPAAPRPIHYPAVGDGMAWCLPTETHATPASADGYFGRDHGDASGIPPDGAIRTNWGIYPAGGLFDEDQDADVKNAGTDGGLGAGIAPIMMSSFVDFMRAERALAGGDVATARTFLEDGMRNSIDRVISWSEGVASGGADGSAFAPTQADIDAYVADILALYDAGTNDDKMDVLQYQNHHALWGNGYEAWNAYRRTGAPSDLQFTREQADPGTFPRLMLYPADYVNLNSSIQSNRTIDQQVFWDTNPAGFID